MEFVGDFDDDAPWLVIAERNLERKLGLKEQLVAMIGGGHGSSLNSGLVQSWGRPMAVGRSRAPAEPRLHPVLTARAGDAGRPRRSAVGRRHGHPVANRANPTLVRAGRA